MQGGWEPGGDGSDRAGGEAAGENMGRMKGGGIHPKEDEEKDPRGDSKTGMAPVPPILRGRSRPAWEWLFSGQDAGQGISRWEGHVGPMELAEDVRNGG